LNRATISLHVNANERHLDIFLENGNALVTYECDFSRLQSLLHGDEIGIRQKKEHRLEYLDYQGEISGNRGNISIIWQGNYQKQDFKFKNRIKIKMVLNYLHYIES